MASHEDRQRAITNAGEMVDAGSIWLRRAGNEQGLIGCGADHGGCGCMGLWDCAHDNKLQRATETIARLANYGMGCEAAKPCVGCEGPQPEVPCGRICQCRCEALAVLRAVFAGSET